MNDDILTLYYYNDGLTQNERGEVENALAADAALRERYDALCRQLNKLADVEDVSAPADLTARFHDTIERAARLERQREPAPASSLHLPSFAWGSAVVATLVVGIAIGFYFGSPDTTDTLQPDAPTVAAETRSPAGSAFTRGLQVHLQQSRLDLASIPNSVDAEREMLIMHIVQQNRLFERAAQNNQSDDLARVLRAFEPILLRLAADDITPEESARLQAQLAFELNVMLTKLGGSTSNDTSTT